MSRKLKESSENELNADLQSNFNKMDKLNGKIKRLKKLNRFIKEQIETLKHINKFYGKEFLMSNGIRFNRQYTFYVTQYSKNELRKLLWSLEEFGYNIKYEDLDGIIHLHEEEKIPLVYSLKMSKEYEDLSKAMFKFIKLGFSTGKHPRELNDRILHLREKSYREAGKVGISDE